MDDSDSDDDDTDDPIYYNNVDEDDIVDVISSHLSNLSIYLCIRLLLYDHLSSMIFFYPSISPIYL